MDDPIWDATMFTNNRERLLAGDMARAFLEHVVADAHAQHLLSSELLRRRDLDRGLGESQEFRRKDAAAGPPPNDPGNPTVDSQGERRSNATHASTTNPDPRFYRKGYGQETKLYHQGTS